ncbi:hypothetical protein Tco_1021996 [Tanacetum coccineum]
MRLQHRHLYQHLNVQFRRTSLTGFPAQSVRSSNAYALDSPYLLVLNTGTSQSRQHGTDISKNTRKPSQNGQTRTQERKSVQEPGIQSQSQKKSSFSQLWVNKVNSLEDKSPMLPKQPLKFQKLHKWSLSLNGPYPDPKAQNPSSYEKRKSVQEPEAS